jgi:DNA-binding IclR family transcriptional regulator
MTEISYDRMLERLSECEMLAATARDRGVREKASELARGYLHRCGPFRAAAPAITSTPAVVIDRPGSPGVPE